MRSTYLPSKGSSSSRLSQSSSSLSSSTSCTRGSIRASGWPEAPPVALLEVSDLKTHFRTDDGIVKAVDGVSFSVEKGQTLGIVGESGCGKSVTCLTIMGLNARANTISAGHALWKGKDLLRMSSRQLRSIRGDEIAMIF